MSDDDPIVDLKSAGFRMPPEWHPHAATWMAWPHNTETWPHNLSAAQDEFRQLAAAISKEEPVLVIGDLDDPSKGLDKLFEMPESRNGEIQLLNIPTNDAWIRDFGPTFCINPAIQRLAAIDWQYNAWGGKYPPYEADQQAVVRMLADPTRIPNCLHVRPDLCLEGGALEMDEEGLLLCTTDCALNPNRNPNLNQKNVTDKLEQTLGANHTIWISGGSIPGDDTDGHIDQQARFTPSGAILYAWSDPADVQFSSLAKNLKQLRHGLQTANINKQLVPLPLPAPVSFQGRRLPASYCNFYVTNHSVWVPQFDAPEDRPALEIIAQHFPQHAAVGLPSRNLLAGLGSFHCLTQQQPVV
ncbi:MAG: agmatine deiminase family protein [Mariniblastus sp.]|nr:agmatine deiminase family protein [Mariniblastus sp.]